MHKSKRVLNLFSFFVFFPVISTLGWQIVEGSSTRGEAAISTGLRAQPQARGLSNVVFDYVVDILWRRADDCFHMGKYEEDAFLCKVIVTLEPSFTEAYSVGGWILDSLERQKEAEEFYKQGIAANPNVYDLYYELGMYYCQRKKDYKSAIPYFEKAVKFPCPFSVWHMLGHSYRYAGELKKSLEVWEKTLKLYPNDQVAVKEINKVKEMLKEKGEGK